MASRYESSETPELKPCRYCKTPIEKGSKRCPYCGILTPHSDVKTTLVWIGIVLFVVWVYSLFRY